MPKNQIIMVIGVCIALLPMLGFPKAWESFFQVLAGLSIVTILVWSSIDKKLTLKAKAQQRQMRRPAEPDQITIPQSSIGQPNQGPERKTEDLSSEAAQSGLNAADFKTDSEKKAN